MKYLYAPLILLLLASCAEEKKETPKPEHSATDWAFYKLNGDVQSVSEKSLKLTAGPSITGSEIATAHDTDLYFDENGNLISEKQWAGGTNPFEEKAYNGREKLLRRTQYIAGKPGIVTENLWNDADKTLSSETRRNPDNTQIDRITYTYKDGRLAEKLKVNAQNNALERYTYIYDKKGNLIQDAIYKGTEILQSQGRYKYDANGNKIFESRLNDGKAIYTTRYQYDGKNLVKQETSDAADKAEYTEIFTHDATGNVTKHVTIEHAQNLKTEESITYDKSNRIATRITEKAGQPAVKVLYAYDENGNLTATKTADSEGKTLDDRKYTFEYDTHKNWVKKKVAVNGQPAFEVTRTITYHEDKK